MLILGAPGTGKTALMWAKALERANEAKPQGEILFAVANPEMKLRTELYFKQHWPEGVPDKLRIVVMTEFVEMSPDAVAPRYRSLFIDDIQVYLKHDADGKLLRQVVDGLQFCWVAGPGAALGSPNDNLNSRLRASVDQSLEEERNGQAHFRAQLPVSSEYCRCA
jgi:hypothetical protein